MTNTYHAAIKITKAIKEYDHSILTVIGGPHPSIFIEQTLENPSVDFVIFGEGEYTITELCDTLESGGNFSHIKGLAFKESNRIIVNGLRPLISNLDELPFPARQLLNLSEYPLRSLTGKRMATMISSRGCPYNCAYCYKGLLW